MGQGYKYICKKCYEVYSLYTGIGLGFPHFYQQTLKEVARGKYGSKEKELFKKIPFLGVDAETNYYECDNCGYWEAQECLDLYQPKNVEKLKKKQFGEKTAEEWSEVPYATHFDLKQDYKLIKKRIQECPKCHSIMKEKNRKTIISCPNCGTRNRPVEEVLWD